MVRRISFFIYADGLQNKSFTLDGVNPGVGGTAFVTIQLALMYAKMYTDTTINIYTDKTFILCNKNINIVITDIQHAIDIIYKSDKHLVIVNDQDVKNEKIFKKINKYIACIMHFPYYRNATINKANFFAYVSVSKSAYNTNRIFYLNRNHKYIQNIFFPDISKQSTCKKPLTLTYLGALTPQKAFHILAENWLNIKKKFPSVTLNVIGSARIHDHNKNISNIIPTTYDYEEYILRHIPREDIESNRVKFHGLMGAEKEEILLNTKIGIVNPSAITEAFPASPLEFMKYGIPVISKCDFGLRDLYSWFPELSLRKNNTFIQIIENLQNESVYNELSLKVSNASQHFKAKSYESILKWRILSDTVEKDYIHDNKPSILKDISRIIKASL